MEDIESITEFETLEHVDDIHRFVVEDLGIAMEDVRVEFFPDTRTYEVAVDVEGFDPGEWHVQDLENDVIDRLPNGLSAKIVKRKLRHISAGDDPAEPDELLRNGADVYEQKNADYGGSWRLAGETLAMWADELDAEIDIQDEQEAVSIGLYFQRMHKLTRGFNLEFGQGNPENEPIVDSHGDEKVYAAMHESLAQEGSDGE